MQKITPCLWFENQAEEAANYYTSIFKNSKVTDVMRAGDAVITASFILEGQEYLALNGGPAFNFTEAVSFMVGCDTQEEVDSYWDRLIADGGEESMCGWLKDKYGLSWQITPNILLKLIQDPDPVKANNVMQAMLQMQKIDIARIQAAYEGK